jgi:hypothetical protein
MVLAVSHLVVIHDLLDVEFPSLLRLVLFVTIEDDFKYFLVVLVQRALLQG